MKIIAIYDNGGKTLDRYTVFIDHIDKHPDNPFKDQFPYLGMDEGGSGFSQWGFVERDAYARLFKRQGDGQGQGNGFKKLTHIGRLVPFETLSLSTQRHIAQRVLIGE